MPCNVDWLATIPHGLPSNHIPFHSGSGDYLAFLGRIAPEKRPDRAIEIAKRAGLPLKIAAKVDAADRRYFEETIQPLLKDSSVSSSARSQMPRKALLGNASHHSFRSIGLNRSVVMIEDFLQARRSLPAERLVLKSSLMALPV
jgi:glycosyltransferase involved in cell wall biosynthesis